MNQIGDVLARDRRFEKVGFDDRSANGGLHLRLHLVHCGFVTLGARVGLASPHGRSSRSAGQLTRPTNLVLGAATVPLGAAMVLGDDWTSEGLTATALFALSVVSFMGAGNAMNDLRDVEVDKVVHPHRPLPAVACRGRLRPGSRPDCGSSAADFDPRDLRSGRVHARGADAGSSHHLGMPPCR